MKLQNAGVEMLEPLLKLPTEQASKLEYESDCMSISGGGFVYPCKLDFTMPALASHLALVGSRQAQSEFVLPQTGGVGVSMLACTLTRTPTRGVLAARAVGAVTTWEMRLAHIQRFADRHPEVKQRLMPALHARHKAFLSYPPPRWVTCSVGPGLL